jgi:AcrR family transcriptional regulator
MEKDTYQLIRPNDAMRRQPKQDRSIKVVNAIVEAAHSILLEHGRDALSTTTLEVVSGVPKSSIYQYFPNLDTIVFEVYRLVIRTQHLKGYQEFPRDKEHTVLSFIYWLLDWSIEIHRKVLEVDKTLLVEHKGFLDAWQELDVNIAPESSTESFIYEQLKLCSDFKPSSNDMLRVHALGRAAQLMVYSLISDNIDFIDDPEFRNTLAKMCYAIFAD